MNLKEFFDFFDIDIPNRVKPISMVMDNIDGTWVPMWVCAFCGNGPIVSNSDDSCCD